VLSRAVRERRDCVSAVRVRFLACASLQFSAENGRQPRKARKNHGTLVTRLVQGWFAPSDARKPLYYIYFFSYFSLGELRKGG